MRSVGPNAPKAALVLACLAISLAAAPASAQWTWKAAKEAGFDLPKRWGLDVTGYTHRQDYELDSLTVSIPGFDVSQAGDIGVRNNTETINLVADYWLFPWLDVIGRIGKVTGTTKVDVSDVELPTPVPISDLKITYRGLVYGLGVQLAGGWDRYFGTLMYHYTNTDLDVSTSSVKAHIAGLRFGVRAGERGGAVWIGTQYHKIDEGHVGTFEVPILGSVDYDVTLTNKNAMNLIAGANAPLGEHLELRLEAGMGNRQSAMLSLGYRFGS